MLRRNNCLFCALYYFPVSRIFASQIRQYAQTQKKIPSRMTLSPRVGQANPRTTSDGKSVKRRAQDGPFGAMNLKEAKIRGIPERRSSQQERRSGGKDGYQGIKKTRSEGFKALKMAHALAPTSYNRRTAIKEEIAKIDEFEQFSLLPIVQQSISTQALAGLKDISPTPVQRIAIPVLLGDKVNKKKSTGTTRQEFLLAAETGSGKTLAYLLPTINAVKLAEIADEEVEEHGRAREEEKVRNNDFSLPSPPLSNQPHPTTGRPRAIILLPTTELVSQVGNLVKAFSHTVKFRSALISASVSGKVIRNRLFSDKGIDILISTPHLLSSIAESDPNILSRVTHLVVDEADSLLDRGFSPLTSAIIDKATPSLQQLILCSATIPRSMDSFLRKRFPDINRLVTPNLHAIPRRVQLQVVEVEKDPYRGNKSLACADTIWTIGKAAADHELPDKNTMEVKRMLVFVNEREKAAEVAGYLTTKGINAVALSRDTPEQRQQEILAEFTSSAIELVRRTEEHPGMLSDNLPNYQPIGAILPKPKRSLPNTKVLVTTDLGSRGIDTLAVRHVILYDVPHSTIDFIHRLGRTGRMGRRGRGIVLVGKHDRSDVVREVREGMFKGQALI